MKKVIIKYGIIAGAIVTAFMLYGTYSFINNPNFEASEVLGYTGMLVAFSFVFIGIRSFRDKQNNGIITFGQAFKVGFLIALIGSAIYVAVWLVEYYMFFPDFMDKYVEFAKKGFQKSGMTAIEIKAKLDEMKMYREWYKNPLLVILLTFAEILPLGLIVALLSAFILKRKTK